MSRWRPELGYGRPDQDGAWSLTLFGTFCLAGAVSSIFVASWLGHDFERPCLLVYIGLCIAGAALAIFDIVREEQTLFSWIVCIANLLIAAPAILVYFCFLGR